MYTCDQRWWMRRGNTCCTIHRIPNKKRLMCDLKTKLYGSYNCQRTCQKFDSIWIVPTLFCVKHQHLAKTKGLWM
jgi:hypothetical protein